ncbi:MAG: carbohydrate kinase family protein [Gammaproteobacteria bacterium]|nr:carbohydrate kinase family protein [Gammaproteobacteria bacterium]|tara:strand:+ start:6664 stop:7599 length:936 start_codon:yes stop_codon:yes gene_type:complete
MSALICGSVAYDNIMVFEDSFKNHILPDQIDILNVSFLVPELRRNFGGCALNIAFNLRLLGEDPIPMGTAGCDFDVYSAWLEKHGIRQDCISVLDDVFTAQAYITTDIDDNQIIMFHPGAMNFSHLNKVSNLSGVSIGMISPDGRTGMLEHASQFFEEKIPFIFDPGQGLPMFAGDELRQFIDLSTWVTVNNYEWELLKSVTGWELSDIRSRTEALIVTRGAEGSVIYTNQGDIEIPPVKPNVVNDPTGCGDAYRAGLLFGLMNTKDWITTGRIASLMGAIKVESHGTQNHSFSMESFEKRFEVNFGKSIR